MKKLILTFVVAAALMATGAPAFAQQEPVPGPRGGQLEDERNPVGPQGRGDSLSEEKREEVRKKMETVRIWRLTEALKLDEKTAAKFLPIISSQDQKRRDLMRENMESVRELRVLLDAKSPEGKKLKAVLEKIEKNQREMTKLREKEFEAARDYLTVEQQARYLVFQHEFMREMRGMISGARGQGRGMRGMGGQGMGGGPMSGRPSGPMDDESYEDMPASPPRQQR